MSLIWLGNSKLEFMDLKRQLIVVDDEADIRRLVAKVGEGLGYEVTEVADSRDFGRVFSEVRPDAVVIDMVMPYQDGFDLIKPLVDRDRSIKVVIVTGYNPLYARTAEIQLAARGVEDVQSLNKPFTLKELRQALDPAELLPEPDYRKRPITDSGSGNGLLKR